MDSPGARHQRCFRPFECLKLRKSHRTTINNTLLKARSENLLYGLIVASGKLVSVVRPKKHSLHPGDLHLIFNMLFEAGSVKAGGGENWIPLCLPGFNNTGYLYMYVSFLNLEDPAEQMQERPRTRDGADDEVAVLLISAEKESFFELRSMRDDLVEVCVCFLYKKTLYSSRLWSESRQTVMGLSYECAMEFGSGFGLDNAEGRNSLGLRDCRGSFGQSFSYIGARTRPRTFGPPPRHSQTTTAPVLS